MSPRQKDAGGLTKNTGSGDGVVILDAEQEKLCNSTLATPLLNPFPLEIPKSWRSSCKRSVLKRRILDLLAKSPLSDDVLLQTGRLTEVIELLSDLRSGHYPAIHYEIIRGQRVWFLNVRGGQK